jgi:hypothetical protein
MDDDRLLAYVLGLDDDPELVAAAATDSELGSRLEEVRAEVDAVAAGVRAAVPAPDETYTDLSDARWAGLQEYFTPARERPRRERRGSRRWLRVLAPVAAVALAVAIGVSVIERQGGADLGIAERSGKTADTSSSAHDDSAGGGPAESGSTGASVADGVPAAATSVTPEQSSHDEPPSGAVMAAGGVPVPATSVNRLAALSEQMDDFAVIVLATAQQAADGFQDFLVLRVFRGDSPPMLRLKLAGRLADVGRLHLVMLEPLSASAASPFPAASTATDGWTGETTSTALVVAAEAEMFTSTVPVVYTYEGDMAVARALPEGTDPATVTLP